MVPDRVPVAPVLEFKPPPDVALDTTAATRDARRAVRQAAEGAPSEMVDRAELAVSELVQNALDQASTCAVAIWHSALQRGMRVEVEDAAGGTPQIRPLSPDRPGGFGLRIVDGVVDRWGWEPLPFGKRVWFEVEYP